MNRGSHHIFNAQAGSRSRAVKLFERFESEGIALSNRIVRTATYMKCADEDGHVTDDLIDIYRELAEGGSGLIITEGALVHPSGRLLRRMLSAHADSYVEGLSALVGALRERGSKIALQLTHGGPQCQGLMLGGEPAMGPSEDEGVRAMEDSEIWAMVDAFGDAAYRAASAGFDAVEIQAAHGYLISSFLSPRTNRRDDYWGGDAARCAHLLEEVVKAAKAALPTGFPLMVKLNAVDMLRDGSGITLVDAERTARAMGPLGVHAIEVTGGTRMSEGGKPGVLKDALEPYFIEHGTRIKAASGLPVILGGGFRSMAHMQDALEGGGADLIGLSRPLIREPDLPLKLRDGKQIADCLSCMGCTRFSHMDRIRCTETESNKRL